MKTSRYNFLFKFEGKNILFNSKTTALAMLSDDEYDKLAPFVEKEGISIDSDILEPDLVKNLSYGGFFIDDSFDEIKSLRFDMFKARFNSSSLSLTIAPTLACNFNCPYCYERTSSRNLTITDDADRQVVLTKKPERIVPLSASFLEPLHAVDGKIVARVSAKTGIPKEDENLPQVGNVYNINIEKVIEAQPDLVIAYKGMNDKFVSTFEENGIPVVVLEMRTYDQVKHTVDVLGQIAGNPDKAKTLIQDMDNKIAEIKAKLPNEHKRIAILHSTAQNVTVQLEGSIAGSTAEILEFENIAKGLTPLESNPTSAPYSLETLVSANPDVIFVTSMGKLETIKKSMMENIENNPAWQTLPAVKEKRVYFLPQELFLLSLGIHYPEAVETMAKLVYPDKFN